MIRIERPRTGLVAFEKVVLLFPRVVGELLITPLAEERRLLPAVLQERLHGLADRGLHRVSLRKDDPPSGLGKILEVDIMPYQPWGPLWTG